MQYPAPTRQYDPIYHAERFDIDTGNWFDVTASTAGLDTAIEDAKSVRKEHGGMVRVVREVRSYKVVWEEHDDSISPWTATGK